MKTIKKLLLLNSILLLSCFVLAGCGRRPVKPMTEEEKFAAELNEYFEEEERKYNEEMAQREKEDAENEDKISTFKIYDVSPEWDKLNNKTTGIQIDDTVYYSGMTFDQVKNALESSEVDYEYELNDKQLVTAHEEVKILVKRENIDWFYLYFINVWNETKTLSEIPLAIVYTTTDTGEDCYRRFGYTEEEILNVAYEDIESFILNLYGDEANVTVDTSSAKFEDEDCIVYKAQFAWDYYTIAKEGLWTGYNIMFRNPIKIYLSKATSEVVGYSSNPSYTYGFAEYPMSKEIADYEHQMNTLLEVGLEELKTNNPNVSIDNASVAGAYVGIQYEWTYYFDYLAIILELDVDDTKKYTLVAFAGPPIKDFGKMDAFGNFIYSNITTHDLCDSFEEALSNAEVTEENMVSKTF